MFSSLRVRYFAQELVEPMTTNTALCLLDVYMRNNLLTNEFYLLGLQLVSTGPKVLRNIGRRKFYYTFQV